MLADVGRGDEDLGKGDGVVGEEVKSKEVLGIWVLVDDTCNVDDEANGL